MHLRGLAFILMLTLTSSALARDRDWSWLRPWGDHVESKDKPKHEWTFAMEFGWRYFAPLGTPTAASFPVLSVPEVQPTFWYKQWLGFSIPINLSWTDPKIFSYGLGVRLPFMTFGSGTGGLFLAVDWVMQGFGTQTGGEAWSNRDSFFRYGASFIFDVADDAYMTLMCTFTTVNGQTYLAPYGGIAIRLFE